MLAITSKPRLFEGRITLSTGKISIRLITQYVLLSLIRWIAIYPLDSVIHPLYNWALTIKTEANLTELKSKLIGYRPESVIYLRQFIHRSYQ